MDTIEYADQLVNTIEYADQLMNTMGDDQSVLLEELTKFRQHRRGTICDMMTTFQT